MMVNVVRNQNGVIVQTIEKEQNYITKKYLGKKKDGTGFIFISQKIITQLHQLKCL